LTENFLFHKKAREISPFYFYAFSGVLSLDFICCVLFFTVEGPSGDDPEVIFRAIANFFNSDNKIDKFYFLADRIAEHRLLVTRIYGLLSIFIFDFISIQFLIVIGIFSIYAFIFLLYREMKISGAAKPRDFLIFCALLLCPAYWSSISSGSWGTSNFASILYSCIAIVFLNQKNWRGFIGFEIFMSIAIFSQTNGGLLIFLLPVVLLLNKPIHYKKMIFLHSIFSMFLVYAYFNKFIDAEILDAKNSFGGLAVQLTLENIFFMGINYIFWIITWLGNWIVFHEDNTESFYPKSMIVSAFFGAFILIFSVVFIKKNISLILIRFQPQFWMLIFIFMSIVGGSFSRSLIFSAKFALSDRYRFYSLCIVALLYSLFVSVQRHKKQQNITSIKMINKNCLPSVFAIIYCALVYFYSYEVMQNHKSKYLRCVASWNEKKEAKPCWWHGENGNSMHHAESLGIMRIDKGVFD